MINQFRICCFPSSPSHATKVLSAKRKTEKNLSDECHNFTLLCKSIKTSKRIEKRPRSMLLSAQVVDDKHQNASKMRFQSFSFVLCVNIYLLMLRSISQSMLPCRSASTTFHFSPLIGNKFITSFQPFLHSSRPIPFII